MQRKVKKHTWICINCNKNDKKTNYIKKTIQWYPVYICKSCWYYNWETIFIEYIEVEKKELIF